MAENKTQPTHVPVNDFLTSLGDERRVESEKLIALMRELTGEEPVMWGPSIVGFGSYHYEYESGREGDMPQLGFSPRKTALTLYLVEGFEAYGDLLAELGPHTTSVGCLYIKHLKDIDENVLKKLLEASYHARVNQKPVTEVSEYVETVPVAARQQFDVLRQLVRETLPHAREVVSYGIIGYKIDDKRARVYVSGWKDHVALYPVPKDPALEEELAPYRKGKGTLWFSLDTPLPLDVIRRTVIALSE